MSDPPPPTSPVDFFEVVTITAGTKHANVIQAPPEGRKVERIWTVIDLKKLADIGPVHNVSAFLEDHLNDYRFNREGHLRYYSRVAETNNRWRSCWTTQRPMSVVPAKGCPRRLPVPSVANSSIFYLICDQIFWSFFSASAPRSVIQG
jgi:hypothetical protein